MKKNNYKLLSGLLAGLLACLNAFAGAPTVVNSTWVGDGSSNFFNGEWSDGTLWNPNGVPNDGGGTVYDATIPYDQAGFIFNGPTLDTNVTIRNLTLVNRAIVDNQINNGTNLTVTGSTTFTTTPGFEGQFGVITAAGSSTFNLGTLTNYNAATKTLEGARFSAYVGATIAFRGADVVTNNGELVVGGAGSRIINQDTGTNAFANIAVNNFSFSIENGLSFTTAGNFTNNGSLSVRSGNNSTTLTIAGALTNYNAATFTLTGGFYFLDGPGNATLRFADADIRVISDATVIVDGTGAAITDLLANDALRFLSSVNGNVTLGGNRAVSPIGGNLQVTGNFTVANNSVISVGEDYTQAGGQLTLGTFSHMSALGTMYASDTIIALGTTFGSPLVTTITANGGFTVTNFSQLTGTGTAFGDLTFTADSSWIPGFSAGQIDVQGNVTMDSTTSFVMEIGGLLPGEEFDLIAQTGAFTTNLGGSTLVLSFVEGFENSITNSDTFDIITSENPILGSFGNVASGDRLGTADGRGSFRVTYTGANAVTLSDFLLPPQPVALISRKMHGAFQGDLSLPLTGAPGVEPRSGGGSGIYQMIISFPTIVNVGGATLTGTGTVSNVSVNGGMVTVNLSGVANLQTIVITLTGVDDGVSSGNVSVSMRMLLGDVTRNGAVNGTDVSQVKIRSGQAAGAANFVNDVNASGAINGTDVSIVKLQSGTGLPAQTAP